MVKSGQDFDKNIRENRKTIAFTPDQLEGLPEDFMKTHAPGEDGKIVIYASEAKFTDDVIEDGYFGVAGVAEIPDLENKLIKLARGGFKHHTAICEGHVKEILKEAFTTYLGYTWVDID